MLLTNNWRHPEVRTIRPRTRIPGTIFLSGRPSAHR